MNFKLVSYILAIGMWNTIFTGITVGFINITCAFLNHPLLTKFDIVFTFMVGYIILFFLNLNIINEDT